MTSQLLSPLAIIRNAIELFMAIAPQIIAITLIVYLPLEILLFAIRDTGVGGSEMKSFLAEMRIQQIYDFILGTLVTLTIISLTLQQMQGSASWRTALSEGSRLWGNALGTTLLAGVKTVGLLLLGIIPGIIWAVYYSFTTYVVATQNLHGNKALDASKALVKGLWWRVLGTMVLFFVISAMPFFVLLVIWSFVQEAFPLSAYIAIQAVNVGIGMIFNVGTSFFTVLSLLFFQNIVAYKKASEDKQFEAPIDVVNQPEY